MYSGYTFVFICTCVPWELNPQPFAPVMQCSTTEPQEHNVFPSLKKKSHFILYDGKNVPGLRSAEETIA